MPERSEIREVRWDGILDRWSFRGGYFYSSADIPDGRIHHDSSVWASACEMSAAGERVLGDAVLLIGGVAPYEGGVRIQVGTDSVNLPFTLRLAVRLLVWDTA